MDSGLPRYARAPERRWRDGRITSARGVVAVRESATSLPAQMARRRAEIRWRESAPRRERILPVSHRLRTKPIPNVRITISSTVSMLISDAPATCCTIAT